MKFYDEIKATLDAKGTLAEGVFRWVDRETMFGQYSDMDTWWAGAATGGQGAASSESQEEEDSDSDAASWSERFANDPQRSEVWVRAAKETEQVIEVLSARGGFGRENGSILHVQRGEVVHFEIPDTDMYETISSTNTSLRHLGKGTLVLTNKRLVFIYSAMTKSINYDDIAVFTTDWLPHAGIVRISVEKRVRMIQFNTSFPLICGMVYHYYTDRGFKARLDGYFRCDAADPRWHDLVGEMLERMNHAVSIEDNQEKERRRREEERRLAEIRSRQQLAEYRRKEEEERTNRLIARICYWCLFIAAICFLMIKFVMCALILFVVGFIIRHAFKE